MKYQDVTKTPGENSYFLVFNLLDKEKTEMNWCLFVITYQV